MKEVVPSFLKNLRVACHTDNIGPGSVFVAIKGMKEDGANYIFQAIEKGATSIVVENNIKLSSDILNLIEKKNIKLVYVKNSREALSKLSAQAYGYPSQSLKIIGVTGTKGKTSTAYLIEHLLKISGYKTALISSVKNCIGQLQWNSNLTTPQPDYLHAFFDLCRLNKIDYVVVEISAQSISLHRVDDILFDSVVFTNFSAEHFEFYSSIDEYFNAKVSILNRLKPNGFLIINNDDQRLKQLIKNVKVNAITFGLESDAKFNAKIDKNNMDGLTAQINADGEIYNTEAPYLIGKFNLYNTLAALSFAHSIGINSKNIQKAVKTFKGVPGRFEKYYLPNGAVAIIDYAHNPSSFNEIFSTLKSFSLSLIAVFGAGGERDHKKRPIMGEIAAKFADKIILTTDNPRSEDARKIVNDIKSGITPNLLEKVFVELDRKKAIEMAYEFSSSDSIILLLGKGSDEYQLINGNKIYFSESQILASL